MMYCMFCEKNALSRAFAAMANRLGTFVAAETFLLSNNAELGGAKYPASSHAMSVF